MGCQHGEGQGEARNWSVNLLIQTDTEAHQPMTSKFDDLMSPAVSSSPNTPVTWGKLHRSVAGSSTVTSTHPHGESGEM